MTSDFKRGLITGLAMQPLFVAVAPPLTKPIIDIDFDGNIINKGRDKTIVANIDAEGDPIVYAIDDGDKKCFSATNRCGVTLSNCKKYLDGDFTMTWRFKINDDGLDPYRRYRRIVWFTFDNRYTGVEIGYDGWYTTNKICIAYNGGNLAIGNTPYNDGQWHTAICRKYMQSMHLTIDDISITALANIFLNPSDNICFSLPIYPLNGYIADFKLYNKITE